MSLPRGTRSILRGRGRDAPELRANSSSELGGGCHEGQEGLTVGIRRGGPLVRLLVAAEHDPHLEAVVHGCQGAEGAAEELAQLVLPRQPQRVLDRHRVEGPLGGPVEAEDGARRVAVRLHGHLAHREDVPRDLRPVDAEPVARGGLPAQSGGAQCAGEGQRDHPAIIRAPARSRPGASARQNRTVIPSSGTQFSIASGEYRAEIASVGATLRSLRQGDRDLVLPFSADEVRPRYLGTAALFPWPNRIVDGRYTFEGEERQLAITEPERGHALHGLVAWLDYTATEQSEDAVTLTATVVPQQGYPHRIDTSVRFSLGADGLTCTASAVNAGPSRAPFGTATHPYLVAGPGAADDWTLTLPASRVLEVDERLSPLR